MLHHVRLGTGRRVCPLQLFVGLAIAGVATLVQGAAGDTTVVSVAPYSDEPVGYNHYDSGPAVSADGRFVVFESNGVRLRDRQSGVTELVSVDSSGTPGNSSSSWPAISGDGRYVVFQSFATNLIPDDGNGTYDVFLRDRYTGTTECISVDFGGVPGDDSSGGAKVSADGRFVVFSSRASNLVPNDTIGTVDIFIRDRQTGQTELVSVSSDGTQANSASGAVAISADGRFVAFGSYATNLVPDDTNGVLDLFVRDRQLSVTERVSYEVGGAQRTAPSFGAAISGDGRTVAYFGQYARGQVLVNDRTLHVIEVASVGRNGAANGRSINPSLSGDGRFVAFQSEATNLVSGDTNGVADIFVRDRRLGVTKRASVDSDGMEANGDSEHVSISADGRLVAFGSRASNLVPNDLNGTWDVFMHELGPAFDLTLGPSALAFGHQALYTNTTLSFWLRNIDTTPLPIASVALVGLDRGMFTLRNACSTSVAVGSSCRIRVTFRPTSVGDKSAQLRVVAGHNDVRSRTLAGTGVFSTYSLSPTSVSFGSVPTGTTTAAKVVTISNTGSAVLPVSSITLAGINPYQFVQTHNCPANLAAGARCTISVVFKPTATGSKAALVNIASGGPAAIRSVALLGSARL